MALEDALAGYHRLRVGSCRVIFRYAPDNVVYCVFSEWRSMVYLLLEDLLERGLRLGKAKEGAKSKD